MNARSKPSLRRAAVGALAAALLAVSFGIGVARAAGPGRKPFAGLLAPEQRHALLDAWKAGRQAEPDAFRLGSSWVTLAGSTSTPIVGRASMVINAAGTILYTRTFIGSPKTCDADLGEPADWMPATAYALGDHVSASSSFFMATKAGTSGSVAPQWNTTPGSSTADGSVTWLAVTGRWAAAHSYPAGAVVRPLQFSSFGFNYRATNAGVSGATEPLWPSSPGGTITDGSVVWKAIGFFPGSFAGCQPLQMVTRGSSGTETILFREGDAVGAAQLSGWGEFVAMNASGTAAFRAAIAGFLTEEDESGSGIFLAGPGPGTLRPVAESGDTIGGRFTCGFSTMVGINDSSQVVFDAYATKKTLVAWQASHSYSASAEVRPTSFHGISFIASGAGSSGSTEPAWPSTPGATIHDGTMTWSARVTSCDEGAHGLARFTPGTGNELLVAIGGKVGGATVAGFGSDDDSGSTPFCGGCEYNDIDGVINSSGHVPVVLRFTDGSQGVFNFTAPGTSVSVVRGTSGTIFPRASINDADQVAYKMKAGGAEKLFRFSPSSTVVTVAAVGDDTGLRAGRPASHMTFSGFGDFFDLNKSGNLAFQATLSGGQEGYYLWDGGTHRIREIFRHSNTSSLAPEMVTVNGDNAVAYVTGSKLEGSPGFDDAGEGHETGGAFIWKNGITTKAIAVGDTVGGDTVTGIYAQHQSFVRRQFSPNSCLALAYVVRGDDAEMDCDEGDGTSNCFSKSPLLSVTCAPACPPILLSPAGLSSGAKGAAYSQTISASGGAGPYSFSFSSGTPPPGVSISGAGVIAGTPTASGTFNVTVKAVDAHGCASAETYAIVVGGASQASLAISPSAETTIAKGGASTFTLTISPTQATATTVTLSASDPSIASVAASASIPAHASTATFTVGGVAAGGPVLVSASLPSSFAASPASVYVVVGQACGARAPGTARPGGCLVPVPLPPDSKAEGR